MFFAYLMGFFCYANELISVFLQKYAKSFDADDRLLFDLIQRMLNYSTLRRIRLQSALNHLFIKKLSAARSREMAALVCR